MLVLLREGRNFENALKARDNAIFDAIDYQIPVTHL